MCCGGSCMCLYHAYIFSSVFSMRPSPRPHPLGMVRKHSLTRYTVITRYTVPSNCRKCRFRDPNFKTFPGGMPPKPTSLCPPVTKILATPLKYFTDLLCIRNTSIEKAWNLLFREAITNISLL